jgi:hypothetical protein
MLLGGARSGCAWGIHQLFPLACIDLHDDCVNFGAHCGGGGAYSKLLSNRQSGGNRFSYA